MTDEEIHNIYLHMSGKAEGLVEANGTADFPVLFARAILEYEGMTKDVQNMASKSTYKEQLETKDEPVAWMNKHGACKTSLFREEEAGAKEEYTIPLYTTPQQGCDECGNGKGYALYCLVCAEKFFGKGKEWVSLTDEQIVDLVIKNAGFPTKLAKAIEAKLKDKNK